MYDVNLFTLNKNNERLTRELSSSLQCQSDLVYSVRVIESQVSE